MVTQFTYTATLGWDLDSEDAYTEELDFTVLGSPTLDELKAAALVAAKLDYGAPEDEGWQLVGIVHQFTNRVLYNPTNAPTTTTWLVTR